MSHLPTSQRPFLEHFVRVGLKQRKAILQTISGVQLKAIGEIIHNVLKGNVPLSSEQEDYLKKHRSVLYVIADRKLRPNLKRQVLEKAANTIKYVLCVALEHLPWLQDPS